LIKPTFLLLDSRGKSQVGGLPAARRDAHDAPADVQAVSDSRTARAEVAIDTESFVSSDAKSSNPGLWPTMTTV
jgi:hypothetical protein